MNHYIDLSSKISRESLFLEWIPDIDPNLVAAATVGSSVFGAISAVNSFRQVSELQAINRKLDTVIDLQYLTIKAIKDLGVQFRVDLENAFIRDVELELKACHQSFKTLTDVMMESENGIVFPAGGSDYKGRLESLMWKTQDLTNKLAGYGHPTHQALFAGMALLDSMFKVAGVDFRYRVSYLNQRAIDIVNFQAAFEQHQGNLSESNATLYAREAIAGVRGIPSGPPGMGYPFQEVRGNPREGFEWRAWVRESQPPPPFRPVSEHPASNRWLQIQNEFRLTEVKIEGMKQGVLAFVENVRVNTNTLISLYGG